MRWALTGVPGTGKTEIADALAHRVPVIHLNDIASQEGLLNDKDEARDSFVVDMDALAAALNERLPATARTIVEGHFAHEMDVDGVILLRCDPVVLTERLRARGWSEAKVRENVEAEALDILAAEVLDSGVPAREVDTTGRTVEQSVREVWEIVDGDPQALKGSAVGTARWKLESLPWY